jgi:hypothetical protein
MNARFAERHEDLLIALFLALDECVRVGRMDRRNMGRIFILAAKSSSGAVREMLEWTHDKLKPDPIAAAIGARRAPTMSEVAEVLKCTPTQSR